MDYASLKSNEEPAQESAHKPDWAALRLLNQYRLLILMALAAIYYLGQDQRMLGSEHATFFVVTHIGYLLVTLVFITLNRLQRPSINTQFFVQNYLDILFISMLMFSSGGVNSGLGPLLLINIALLSQLSSVRHALLFAAIASIVVIGEELLGMLLLHNDTANFQSTALLGSLLFLTAWLMTVPLRHLLGRQMVTPSHSRAVLDVRQIAQLNEEIIRELDAGVLVVDHRGHVQLINDTARMLLAVEFVQIPEYLEKLSPELKENMAESERSPTLQTKPFDATVTGHVLLPHYTRLTSGGMLIRLDDHTQIRQQFQQLKLASLGKLSASIAHEIRNPLGAISHAVQLIEESDTLNKKDAELLTIARRHTTRINRIIEDVLQLSNRAQIHVAETLLAKLITDFSERFRQERDLDESQLALILEPCVGFVDAGHLDQVLWNLCTNAFLHNEPVNLTLTISCWELGSGRSCIEVQDNGKGVNDIDRQTLFDPFYSTHLTGTGLGLFITRELCELNKAKIECLPCTHGALFRITLVSAQDMAA